MSKLDKRLEKDEKREKEHQAKLLQERINDEKKRKEEAQKVEVAVEDTEDTTCDSSKPEEIVAAPVVEAPTALSEKIQSCNTCGGAFHDVKTYREHFK
jgi:hypothetical protein